MNDFASRLLAIESSQIGHHEGISGSDALLYIFGMPIVLVKDDIAVLSVVHDLDHCVDRLLHSIDM
jgi:hypothetical protein